MNYRGRFAPSPTGDLHFGSLVAALASWLDARQQHGAWLIRVEDIDTPRTVAGAAEAQLQALQRFGLASDEPVLWQSQRTEHYVAALDRLRGSGSVFACRCSRSDLVSSHGVHHGCVDRPSGHGVAWRLRVPRTLVSFVDRCCGAQQQAVKECVGDFVLQRADGLFTYQLAVVVDDADQAISDVVRGADLLDSTPRQILLQRALQLSTPRYLHLPLVLDASGRKLSKSSASLPINCDDPIRTLRAAWRHLGQDPRQVPEHGSIEHWLSVATTAFDAAAIPAASPAGV